MKYAYLAGLITLVSLASSCRKEEDPNALDYYKNKIITLRIENVDFAKDADYASFRIAATRVTDRPGPNARLKVNGTEVAGNYVEINSEMVEDGTITIETIDSAWQYVIDYDLKADGTPYTITLNSAFNGVEQPVHSYWVASDKPHKGTLEIKEYKNP